MQSNMHSEYDHRATKNTLYMLYVDLKNAIEHFEQNPNSTEMHQMELPNDTWTLIKAYQMAMPTESSHGLFLDFDELYLLIRSSHQKLMEMLNARQQKSTESTAQLLATVPNIHELLEDSVTSVGSSTSKSLQSDASRQCLYDWLEDNLQNPYPTKVQKAQLAKQSRLSKQQLNKWFYNMRYRKDLNRIKKRKKYQ